MSDDVTSIQVSKDLWKELNQRKEPGDTFEDVIRRELGIAEVVTDTPRREAEVEAEVEPEREPTTDDREDEALDQYREVVAGSGTKQEARAQALLRMRNYIRDNGTATRADLLALTEPDDVMLADEDSIWSNMVKGQLGIVDELESDHDGTWRWVGED